MLKIEKNCRKNLKIVKIFYIEHFLFIKYQMFKL